MDETLDCSSERNDIISEYSPAAGFGQKNETIAENVAKNRAEIDTSPPFESVKEAANMFGGSAVWKPNRIDDIETESNYEGAEMVKVEEQAAQLEKDLIVKERETLDVLKELEMTKKIVEELKLKLQREASEPLTLPEHSMGAVASGTDQNIDPNLKPLTEKKIPENFRTDKKSVDTTSIGPAPSPGLILMELKKAKVNLNRTTDDLTGIRASVELLNRKIEKEKISLAKTQERLASNSAKISSLEEDLIRTKLRLQLANDAETRGSENPSAVSLELQKLSSEAEQFKKMAEAAKAEALRTMAEIEQTKTSIKTAEIRWFAAKKMEEAARATEVVALADIKALRNSEKSGLGFLGKPTEITLSFEEYTVLTKKAKEAEELSNNRIEAAMLKIDEANISKMKILKKVEEAKEAAKIGRKALEEALDRVETANSGKLTVEEALRKWRSEHGQKRRSAHNSTKFKNPCPYHHRKNSALIDVNGLSLISDGSKSVVKPALSIGEILSRKLLSQEDLEMRMEEKIQEKPKVSLGQMLNKRSGVVSPQRPKKEGAAHKQFSAKRKKFGFARISLLLAEKKKKKKKLAPW